MVIDFLERFFMVLFFICFVCEFSTGVKNKMFLIIWEVEIFLFEFIFESFRDRVCFA